jgi:pimeloyl-ACP methyl ester carboxylesterase
MWRLLGRSHVVVRTEDDGRRLTPMPVHRIRRAMSVDAYRRANIAAVWNRRFVELPGGRVEVESSPGDGERAPLVFLHEGLGSIDLWRGFPGDVAERAGTPPVHVYSRHGYGRSAPAHLPRPVAYMHHEADVVLPGLLAALGVQRPVLIGHSDGASIALLYAGAGHDVAGIVCLAAHAFVEPESLAGVAAARVTFESTDMAEKMTRYHDDPTATFRGWNDVWGSPDFRSWNIEDRLPGIRCPMLVVQGTADEYGTVAQVEAIASGVTVPVDRLVLDGVGHSPHLEQRQEVAEAIAVFVRSLDDRA